MFLSIHDYEVGTYAEIASLLWNSLSSLETELSKIFKLFETQIFSNFVNNTMFWVIKFEWSSDFQHNWNIWLGFPKDAPFRASVRLSTQKEI